MKILGKELLEQFTAKYADCRRPLEKWVTDAERENWKTPQEIKNHYRSVDFLANNRAIFNIKGNHYRLVVKVRYSNGLIVIEWIGTHAQYSKKEF
ncbi:MAG: type II toxin-antitoxin system HigB family toxin [Neisseria sp.]|nr:type II toxin-antitoxin system HigB family toxin [Neisseria sp.]